MGITETKKLISALKSDVIGLFQVDYDAVGQELADLDLEEKKELLIELGSAVIEILAYIKLGPSSAVVSALKGVLK